MKQSLPQAIGAYYDSLTASEKKIADFLRLQPELVVRMSISDLAARVGTAKSAVVRCCKSLGFSGYADIKVAIAMELAKNHELGYVPELSALDDSGQILDKIFSADVKALHDTAAGIDRENLQRTVQLLCSAKRVWVFGIGTSSSLVMEFQYRLMLYGCQALAFTDVPSMKVATMNIQPGDVAFFISHSGRTIATIETMMLAKEAGADTVCVTSFPESPLAKGCDLPLCVSSDEIHYPVEAMSARIAQLCLLDSITVAFSAQDRDMALARSERSRELINTIRYEEQQT